jgi:alkylation response protein AidB-like acyl-CoA dehydrogenase
LATKEAAVRDDSRLTYAPGSTYIEFDDVVVPVANLLGRENQGFEIIMSS